MASKYHEIHAVMGYHQFNNKIKNGRSLTWHGDIATSSVTERKELAGQILEKLIQAEIYYVQKVVVKNSYWTRHYSLDESVTIQCGDNIHIHIDDIHE